MNMKPIYEQMVEAGVEIASHETDLYVPVNETTMRILRDYPFRSSVTAFTSQIDNKRWFDIPFAYLPAWEQRFKTARKIEAWEQAKEK